MMPLIFFISGASIFHAMNKGGVGTFFKDKALRLFVPLLVAVFTYAPLQVFWPDPEPRVVFQGQVKSWKIPNVEGVDILHQGLILATQEYPLPFVRRTILEFVFPGEEGMARWEGLTGLCADFGLRVQFLTQKKIEALTRWLLNPSLGYH